MRDVLLTALAPIIWGTTYFVTTQFLPPNRPLFVSAIRAAPIGLLMLAGFRELPKGIWLWRVSVLGTLNIGFFFALLFTAAYRLPGGVEATHLYCSELGPVRRGTSCPGSSSQV
jgi:probable blue pigment (indigoidine) exporter